MTPKNLFPKTEYPQPANFENFDLVFDQYAPCIYGTILRAVYGDDVKAEKLTGQVFVLVYHNRHQYDPARQRLFTWLLAITAKLIKEEGYDYQSLPVKTA